MKEKSKKKYFPTDEDKIQKKLQQLDTGNYFKAKEGKNQIRILPPWSKEGIWYKEATLHYGLKNEEGKERGYACLKQFGKDCPACDYRDQMMEGGKEDKKIADRLRPRTKFYANVLDRKSGKVVIWGFSQKTLGTLLSYCGDPDYGDITDPENGFDVIIERTGTTLKDTRYSIRVRPKPSEIGDDTDWENQMKDLDAEVVEDIGEDVLQEVIDLNFGESSGSDDEDEEEDKPKKKKKVEEDEEDEEEDEPKKKKKKVVDDEEDEEEEDEEEKPKKKKKKVEDDDEEDDDEED